ncbi:uncharacterized protein K452DRAFT_332589 [Aplosporella prunicola CBS 121167]|uniref:Uncharacterized protein n=1 Tax=Aplosporella prunicola CBS 121167 TaxID=1176127 RepID=A0A6A6AWQ5_9PEZI|nr:uncharacterized protein K452DRAFT_332589 [Aplosporella prunicola CBS 121167]KAF2135415.1 hypothetical protein K452DRAFT_332589 [Aplosporella prunicola CBS 121167]
MLSNTRYSHLHRSYLTIFQTINSPAWYAYNQTTHPLIEASECAFWYCIKAYEIAVHNGLQHQQTVATLHQALENHSTLSEHENLVFEPDPAVFNIHDSKYFSLAERAGKPISTYLKRAFNGSFNSSSASTATNYVLYSSDIMSALREQTNISKVVSNVALSMTNHIRTASPISSLNDSKNNDGQPSFKPIYGAPNTPDNHRYNGKAYSSEPFYVVRWKWLILPISLVLLTPICLLAATWSSWTHKVPVRGNSPLAVMQCVIPEDLKEELAAARTRSTMHKRAKRSEVRLVECENGMWAFERSSVDKE